MKQFFLLGVFVMLLFFVGQSQNVGINNDGSEPDPSAALDVKATDKGILIPRVDFTALPATPPAGLLVYVTANGPDGNNAFYYYNGTQWQKLSGADGLANFTESNFTYDSKTGVKLTPDNAAGTVDFVLQPKGSGAILAQQPDGTTTGGNKRGDRAVDLQMYRLNASQVASGISATISGGYWNTASAQGATVGGGSANTASSFCSTVPGGSANIASGEYSFAGGRGNTSQSYAETVIGVYATVGSGNQINSVLTDRLFVIGNGSSSTRSNALTILKNANTTIGGSLTLNGNGTNTSITFPTSRGTNGQVLQTDGSGNTSWSSFTGSQWTTSSSNIYYNAGNVGIGTTTPNSSLTFDNSHDSGFDEWSDYKVLLYTDATPQKSYGIGIKANTLAFNSDRDYDFDQDGSTVMTIQEGKVGIGTASPQALLDLGSSTSNRKILLYSAANNDHQFTGLGLNADAFRFQLATTSENYKFYGATSSTASTELFRIQGNGQIMIPALTTAGVLLNSSTGLVSSSVGTSGQVLTTNGSGTITWATPTTGTVTSVSGTAPIAVATGTSTPVISIAAATTSAAGSMSAAEKTKLVAISGTNTGDQTITLTGDVTGSGTGSFAATISSASVSNSKMSTMAANTMKVNNTASSASPSDLSITANTFPARSSTGNIAAKPDTDFALTMLDDANAAAVRTTIGAGTGNGTVTTVSGTAPIAVATGTTTPVISIAAATTSTAGSMSATDKTKLDGLVGSQWTTNGSNIYYNSGNIGIGTTTPDSKLTFSNSIGNGFDQWSDYKMLLYTDATPQQSYGIGIKGNTLAFNSDRDYDFDQDGSTVMTIQEGKVGIGTESPRAMLDLSSSISNRKILLYSSADNDHQFTGFGLNTDVLRFQLANTSGSFKFYGATSATTSDELFRIEGDGDVVAQGQIKNVSEPTDAQDAATKNYVDNRAKTFMVGDFAQGGIVFWVDETGQHGLVCAKNDQSTAVRWYAGTYGNTQAKGDGPYAGEANTSIIIAAQVAIGDDGSTYAARICNELQITEGGKTYGDWYLPSKEELNLMYQNKATIDATAGANGGSGFASAYYWSSTESTNSDARIQLFSNGYQYNSIKNVTNRVRAVRAF
ncbi:MAG: DUF1566 domain-containing protein [Bacteroidales bacterium]|nr:DUF1566 domain-containing protein [Bacteroidales bacterium]